LGTYFLATYKSILFNEICLAA